MSAHTYASGYINYLKLCQRLIIIVTLMVVVFVTLDHDNKGNNCIMLEMSVVSIMEPESYAVKYTHWVLFVKVVALALLYFLSSVEAVKCLRLCGFNVLEVGPTLQRLLVHRQEKQGEAFYYYGKLASGLILWHSLLNTLTTSCVCVFVFWNMLCENVRFALTRGIRGSKPRSKLSDELRKIASSTH